MGSRLLNGCDYKNDNNENENVQSSLGKNVRWEDEEGLISFEVQGRYEFGFGYLKYAGKNLEGLFSFSIGHPLPNPLLNFYSDHRLVPNGRISFDVKYVSLDVLSLTIKNKKEYAFDWTESSKTYYIEKTKLNDDEIDAKYFFNSSWSDSKNVLNISIPFGGEIGKCSGTLRKNKIDFYFLEGRKYYLSTADEDFSSGTYCTYADGTLLLVPEEGNALSSLESPIQLSQR